MKNLKLFEEFSQPMNETYHDMQYDGHDMVLFGKFVSGNSALRAIHNEVKNTVDGVTMDMMMHTYKRAKEEAPEELAKFAEFEKKNKVVGKIPKNMHLILVDDNGDAYRVNQEGMMTQKKNKDFSGGWRFVGLADIKYGRTVLKFEDIDEKKLKEFMDAGILYKNRKPKFTVIDNDHGTTRVWGKGLNHMYIEKI